ncbi:MAG: hypothetical protein FJ295_08380 [Planctomycetes bacterium]|nr:hypothetical protein [Planctomycetota bacterium]
MSASVRSLAVRVWWALSRRVTASPVESMTVWAARLTVALATCLGADTTRAEFRVGAAITDATPLSFPVLVNGGMTANSANKAVTPIHARSIVLDDGVERIAIVVVDSCMMPRDLLDDAKQLASQRTRLRPDRIMISATHTHTAPASMGCLGTDAEAAYVPFLREKLAESIAAAESRLQPAIVGFGVGNAAPYTALRRWIIRPDRLIADPFGNLTVRANMHAGSNWDNVTGESGPEDPDLALLYFRAPDGRPLALLANFSMHYFSGVEPLNADYFGMFCRILQERLGGSGLPSPASSPSSSPFVAMMSHGCSGDIWRRDYTLPASAHAGEPTIEAYSQGLAAIAESVIDKMEFDASPSLAMAERRLQMNYRVPDSQRLEWARRIMATVGERPPRTTEEVYAREQILLHERKSTEVVLQAIRIGQFAIATTPTETYALTGLKLKLQSPLPKTMVIELANGGDGYIPPPEQHHLGGYNTWPARSAGLEVTAEPRITQALLESLESVSSHPRRVYRPRPGAGSESLLRLKPIAYWRLDEFHGPRAYDTSGNRHDGFFEPGVVFFLEGPRSDLFGGAADVATTAGLNRATHFAGGRLHARLPGLADEYAISLWFWNGMPADARGVSGWLVSRDFDQGRSRHGEHFGVGGTESDPGKLIFERGNAPGLKPIVGRTVIARWTWNHLLIDRDRDRIRVFLNGAPTPEIDHASEGGFPADFDQLFVGGRSDNQSNWEGRIDEVAVFRRSLTSEERASLPSPLLPNSNSNAKDEKK